mgnify:CR=1 FL=1
MQHCKTSFSSELQKRKAPVRQREAPKTNAVADRGRGKQILLFPAAVPSALWWCGIQPGLPFFLHNLWGVCSCGWDPWPWCHACTPHSLQNKRDEQDEHPQPDTMSSAPSSSSSSFDGRPSSAEHLAPFLRADWCVPVFTPLFPRLCVLLGPSSVCVLLPTSESVFPPPTQKAKTT